MVFVDYKLAGCDIDRVAYIKEVTLQFIFDDDLKLDE